MLDKEFDLNEDHFNFFIDEFNYWVKKLGLVDWELIFSFDNDFDKDDPPRAGVHINSSGRLLIVTLSKKWQGMEPNEFNLAKCAYHEAVEALLGSLIESAMERVITEREIEEKTHAVIRTLENTHFMQDYFLRKSDKEESESPS